MLREKIEKEERKREKKERREIKKQKHKLMMQSVNDTANVFLNILTGAAIFVVVIVVAVYIMTMIDPNTWFWVNDKIKYLQSSLKEALELISNNF